ncbi:MAG TPA: 3-methyl-2-oxobutanoate hydroxymethyltransferase [Treponema sp.]|nr:3-methyl-2-oxobutanoate hydroxymethyltransferase [Treponema sp.]
MKLSPSDFSERKKIRQKITMVTCYDYTFACLVNGSSVDCVLTGDSCANVMHGRETTIPATVRMIAEHTRAVHRGLHDKFLVADMPFLSTRLGQNHGVRAAGTLIASGADAVKIEGADGNTGLISYLVESGIPVMGHIGLTPQFCRAFGGYKIQGRSEAAAAKLLSDARALEKAGCFAVVAECIPSQVTRTITGTLGIPLIGIGAGGAADGQVLVLHDLLGFTSFKPKFVRRYLDGSTLVCNALNAYCTDVCTGNFPAEEETFTK